MVHEIEKVDDRKCKHAGLGMIVRRGLSPYITKIRCYPVPRSFNWPTG